MIIDKYYSYYFNATIKTYDEIVSKLCRDYLKGLQWILKYYFT